MTCISEQFHPSSGSPGRQVFLTGGTGFLGSHIGVELLRRGAEVSFLVRPGHCMSAAERLTGLFDWHGVDASLRSKSHVIEGDTTQPDLGISPARLNRIMTTPFEIIHCASNTSFNERHRDAVAAANVEGVSHLLDFAGYSGCPVFHHISTAYVAGRTQGECPETLVNGSREFFNVYEETKCRAEWLVWERCRAAGIRGVIYRPAIVYGHSQTGKTFRFNAFYYPIRTVLFLKRVYAEDIRDHGGAKAREMGVSLEPDGSMRLPLRIEIRKDVGVNLIPVDYFLAAFFAIMEQDGAEGIFHLVNDTMTNIEQIIAYSNSRFGLTGIRGCSSAEYHRTAPNALERMFERYLDAYGPYMRDPRTFSAQNTRAILDKRGITCPELDAGIFNRCMEYAIGVGWETNSL